MLPQNKMESCHCLRPMPQIDFLLAFIGGDRDPCKPSCKICNCHSDKMDPGKSAKPKTHADFDGIGSTEYARTFSNNSTARFSFPTSASKKPKMEEGHPDPEQ